MKIVRVGSLQRFLLIVIFGLLFHTHGFTQPSPDPPFGGSDPGGGNGPVTEDDPGDPGDPGNDPDLPIDGNILILVAVGVGYGIKKNWDARQKFKGNKQTIATSTSNYSDYI